MPSKKTVNKKCNQFTIHKLREQLLRWTCERHATNGPLDRELLRHKALELTRKLGLNGFKCSSAWMTMFLKRHGFSTTLTNCCGPYFTDYRKWVELLAPLISQYRYKDLFNVDELVMYPDVLPTKISSIYDKNEESIRTNRLTILTCCNSSGTEKLPLLICGQYNLTILRDDYQYHHDKNSSIAKNVFDDWLFQLNVLMSRKQRKILLLLRRNRIHVLKRVVELSHVNLLFLPVNFPSNLRPFRRDVFHYVKMIYRQNYVSQNLCSNRNKWNPKQIIDNIAIAWSRVPADLIVYSFQRTNFRPDNEFLEIDCTEWESLNTGITFRKFVTFDDSLSDACGPSEQLRCPSTSGRHNYNLRHTCPEVIWVEDCAGDVLIDDLMERNDRTSCSCNTDNLEELDSTRQHSDDCNRDPDAELRDVLQDLSTEIDNNLSVREKCVDEVEEVLNDAICSVLENVEGSLRSIDLDDECSRNLTKSIYTTCERKRLSSKKSDDRSQRDLNAENSALPKSLTEKNVEEKQDLKMETRILSSKEKLLIDSNRTSEVLEDFESIRSRGDDDCLQEDPRGTIEDGKVQDDFENGRQNWKRNGEQVLYVKCEEQDISLKEPDEQCDVSEYLRNDMDCCSPNVDDCSTSLKKKPSNLDSDVSESDNVGEPAKKRFKRDDNWAKYYEKHFVFGTRLMNTMVDRSSEELNEECMIECCKLVSQSKQCKPRIDEFEKSIFLRDSDSTPSSSKE